MSQLYIVVPRKNLLAPEDPPKFYAVARSKFKATVKDVCRRVSERSSYSRGELEGTIGEFLIEVINVLRLGAIVTLGDLGTFRMSLRTGVPTATEKEFKSNCIDRGRIVFRPGSELRELCRELDFERYAPTASTLALPAPSDGDGDGKDSGGELPDPIPGGDDKGLPDPLA
ncbi:MAG: HU family DNA-binding protein [Mediterranea sp.]|jgi:predicted histone-like DNA-binding protein|nr:HU family DNA-binding protein [Mediterranea sp.]